MTDFSFSLGIGMTILLPVTNPSDLRLIHGGQAPSILLEEVMTLERALRLMAGTFVLISLVLGRWVSPYWYLFTAFVGLNLFQSALTNWCPAMTVLRKFGLR